MTEFPWEILRLENLEELDNTPVVDLPRALAKLPILKKVRASPNGSPSTTSLQRVSSSNDRKIEAQIVVENLEEGRRAGLPSARGVPPALGTRC
ncbi:MAG: hypothetical protein HY901_22430 [Deltaproteobacteria bacterium]|nr:hypothetical protein [Deltaproteobacteria bacterium]